MRERRPLLEVRDLRKEFGGGRSTWGRPREIVLAVDGISFDLFPGENFGLVGESGSGKSTVARLVTLLDRPDGGTIAFGGQDVLQLRGHELKEYRRQVQIIFQDPYGSLNPRMTLFDLIAEAWTVHPSIAPPRSFWSERVGELLEGVGLKAGYQGMYPDQFSGGQRQRIGIARALAAEPVLLICDEPVSALDVSIQAQILQLLARLQDERDLTILFIAHDLSVVRVICDRMAVTYRGRIVEVGSVAELFESASHPYTRMLLEAAPRFGLRNRLDLARLVVEAGQHSGVQTGCGFAPRCNRRQVRCWDEDPELTVPLGSSHCVACFFPVSEVGPLPETPEGPGCL